MFDTLVAMARSKKHVQIPKKGPRSKKTSCPSKMASDNGRKCKTVVINYLAKVLNVM
jgi:hypothetical protein